MSVLNIHHPVNYRYIGPYDLFMIELMILSPKNVDS